MSETQDAFLLPPERRREKLFGLVRRGTKYEYHFVGGYRREEFGEKLTDIARIVNPYLSVMDAIVGLEGNGPARSERRKRRTSACGRNPFALDCASRGSSGSIPCRCRPFRRGFAGD
jgi:hypothetical protein